MPSASKNAAMDYILPVGTDGAQSYTSLKTTRYAQSYLSPIDKIYADPGNKRDVIFNWLKQYKVPKINPDDIE